MRFDDAKLIEKLDGAGQITLRLTTPRTVQYLRIDIS